MMVKVLFYGYWIGVFSSRRTERRNVLRLNVLSVPDVIAILASRGTVAIGTALAWLDLLRDTASDVLVDRVAEMLREGGSAPS